jgi:phage/plasmid-like protein (TIGR03299 family)
MSHGIEATDNFGEVRLNGVKAWHGLGVEIAPGLKTWPAFQTIGIDWESELLPVFSTYKGEDGKVKQFRLPSTMAHVRSDTKQLLAVVSDSYKPIGNKELAEFADALVEAEDGVTVETAGTLHDGKVVFALVKLPQDIRVTDQDILRQYVLLRNSHDCSSAFCAYPTSVRVVCANTLRLSETDQCRGITCQHTGEIKSKLDAARSALGMATESVKRYETQVRLLAAKHVGQDEMRQYFALVHDATFGTIQEPVDVIDEKSKARYEHRLEKRDAMLVRWETNFQAEQQTLEGIAGTAWAAYNAVSQWHDHERGRYGTVQESAERVHSNLFGVSDEGKRVAFEMALNCCN